MIMTDETREPPTEWTEAACQELILHAIDLGHNGNPSGYFLQVDTFPFVGEQIGEERALRPFERWDYEGLRGYLQTHAERVKRVWQFQVREL